MLERDAHAPQHKHKPQRTFLTIIFFDSTLRDWKMMLLVIALMKPVQLNETSLRLAMTTPPTMGTSVSSTGSGGTVPRKMALMMTEKKGSIALTVCVNDTATLPSETLVSTLPRTWMTASGATDLSCRSCCLLRTVFAMCGRRRGRW